VAEVARTIRPLAKAVSVSAVSEALSFLPVSKDVRFVCDLCANLPPVTGPLFGGSHIFHIR